MRKPKRTVKAELGRNGIVIFRLMQGVAKPKTVHVYGYGTHHKIWLQVQGLDERVTSMSAEPASAVKEQIARWSK